MASSSIVIKVKFGETLRRLNASINDKKLVLDMVTLQEKIRRLFSIGSDAEFTLTYVDEDGDEITLADDDDLQDVARQSLNPLRITVNLNSGSFNGPIGNSTLLKSPQNSNSGVSEILKLVPEQLLEALAKLPLDLASKASTSSAPVVAELVEKMKDVYLNEILPSMASPRVQSTTSGPQNMNFESSTVGNSKGQLTPEAGGSNLKKAKQVQKVTEGVKFKELQLPRGVRGNYFHPSVGSTKSVGEGSAVKDKDSKKDSSSEKNISSGFSNQLLKQRARFAQLATHFDKQINDSGSFSGWAQGMSNATNQCPFSGMPLTTDSNSRRHLPSFSNSPWKRENHDNKDTGIVFHRGVICDGCGVHPITGPRFKSKVKIDYDLCGVCFSGIGNTNDYIRMDHPATSFRHPFVPFKGFYDPSFNSPPHAAWTPGLKQSKSRLDSRFILDVNVLDGTVMAPFTAFTKIWRMRNSGSIVWPYGSQLQWIGGDRLSNSHSVNVEIPIHGLRMDNEVDIAVDFTAPELPGRYVSYWRMSSPSGELFGQRVWVLIQVDASLKNSGEAPINLNLPPVTRDSEPTDHDHLVDNVFLENNIITDSKNTSVDTPPEDHTASFSINNGGGESSTMGPALGSLPAVSMVTSGLDSEPIRYPTVDFSVMPPIMSRDAAAPPTGPASQAVTDDKEQALVKELEAMGFKNLDLNKEILIANGYDLGKSVDDLCGVLKWGPMLIELREMGFEDDVTNRRLLKKNNGSIKGVVMDLINEEKA